MTFSSIGQISQNQIPQNHSMVGAQLGGTTSIVSAGNTSEIAAWLAGHKPKDMDKAAVSRAQLHGVALQVKTDLRFPSGPNGERTPSYEVAIGCEIDGTDESRAAALADLEKFQTPAPARQIEEWLAELSVISASRGRAEFEAELMVSAYASRLGEYPADIVKYVLLTHSWKWWPTWDELKKVCDAKAGPRRHMVAALKKPTTSAKPASRPPTREERDRMVKYQADAGFAPKRFGGAA